MTISIGKGAIDKFNRIVQGCPIRGESYCLRTCIFHLRRIMKRLSSSDPASEGPMAKLSKPTESEKAIDLVKLADDLVPVKPRPSLVQAAAEGNMSLVESIIRESPSSVEQLDGSGFTPLHAACKAGQLEMVKFLYEKCPAAVRLADIDNYRTPLHTATVERHFDLVRFLYEKYPEAAGMQEFDGSTPLILACLNGDMDMVRFLYEGYPGAIKIVDYDGWTPLHAASASGTNLDVVKFLVEKWPEAMFETDIKGRVPFSWSADSAVETYLLEKREAFSNTNKTLENFI